MVAPVALVFRVKDEKEAIKLANDSPCRLGGSVITKDLERGSHLFNVFGYGDKKKCYWPF